MTEPYNSTADTRAHIARVRDLLYGVVADLMQRAKDHDKSKLEEPEKSGFDRNGQRLAELKYGTEEYFAQLKDPDFLATVRHHWNVNRHHPEWADSDEGWADNPLCGMTLDDLQEMLCDWKAAGERMSGGGDIRKSIEVNAKRFKLSPQMVQVFHNTVNERCW